MAVTISFCLAYTLEDESIVTLMAEMNMEHKELYAVTFVPLVPNGTFDTSDEIIANFVTKENLNPWKLTFADFMDPSWVEIKEKLTRYIKNSFQVDIWTDIEKISSSISFHRNIDVETVIATIVMKLDH